MSIRKTLGRFEDDERVAERDQYVAPESSCDQSRRQLITGVAALGLSSLLPDADLFAAPRAKTILDFHLHWSGAPAPPGGGGGNTPGGRRAENAQQVMEMMDEGGVLIGLLSNPGGGAAADPAAAAKAARPAVPGAQPAEDRCEDASLRQSLLYGTVCEHGIRRRSH